MSTRLTIQNVCNHKIPGVYPLPYSFIIVMASNAVVIGSILGAVLGSCFLLIFLIVFYSFRYCVVYAGSSQEQYKLSDLRLQRRLKSRVGLKNMLNSILMKYSKKRGCDLEGQVNINKSPSSVVNCETNFNSNSTSSRLALKSCTIPSDGNTTPQLCMGNVRDVNIVPCLNKDDATSYSLEYKDAIEKFNMPGGLFSDSIERGLPLQHESSLTYKMYGSDSNNFEFDSKPLESEQSYISDQYDSFTRTLMLQTLIGNSINNRKGAIKEIRDPFLESFISVGGIVVVVKSYHGTSSLDFPSLNPGDLLRVIKFYIKGDGNLSTSGGKCETISYDDSTDTADFKTGCRGSISGNGIYISRLDPNYTNIYCTGILLNTYLKYNKQTRDLSLRFKKDSIKNEFELIKDFPLLIVSLETTVLKTISEPQNPDISLKGKFEKTEFCI